MQINDLKLKPRKKRKRVGRGGNRGTYSTRGIKGQKARSGGNVDPLFEGGRTTLIDRLKKNKGFKSIADRKINTNLAELDVNFSDNETVSIETLVERGFVKAHEAHKGVKILSDGELTKKLTIAKGIKLSRLAIEKIEKAGGKIEE